MLVALIIIPFSQFVIQAIGKSIRRKARRNTKQIGGILSIITENLSTVRIVKAFSMEKNEISRFNQESWKYFALLFRSSKLRLMSSPIIETIGVSMAVILLWLGGSEVMVGSSLSSEDFLRFMFLLFSMLGPVRSLSNVHITLQNGYASAERIFEVLDEKTEVVDSGENDLTELESELKFENVSFNYGEGSFQLININFQMKKGETIAVVGASGAGKSTIADLIPRFYDCNSGSISIDDKSIYEVSLFSLRKNISLVSQDVSLFDDTIINNIRYANLDSSDEQIYEAAKNSFANDFIQNLPQKYETIIGENGVRLSGGEKQRLSIARAMMKKSSIILLDEATSSLDSETEAKIQEALKILTKNKTTVVIAHRLSTILNSNNIYLIDNGKIIDNGKHEDLLISSKIYKNFYEKQIQK